MVSTRSRHHIRDEKLRLTYLDVEVPVRKVKGKKSRLYFTFALCETVLVDAIHVWRIEYPGQMPRPTGSSSERRFTTSCLFSTTSLASKPNDYAPE